VSYDNVIFLPEFRQSKWGKKKQILYLSNHGESLELLQSFHGVSVECASSCQSLNVQLFSWKRWDLILIESDLNWADAKETVAFIHHELQVPVTLIDKNTETEESIFRLKAFYEVGIYDCLRTPLCPRELSEVFRALLR
jgi:DNA-binding response OmpR family regulator